MMKNRAKKIIFILIILIVILIAVVGCIFLFLRVFSKPKVYVSRIEVIPAGIFDQLENGEPNEYYLVCLQASVSGDPSFAPDQLIWQDDKLPSDDMRDYSVARFYFEISNPSMLEINVKNAMVDDYDLSTELLIDGLSAFGETIEAYGSGQFREWYNIFSSDRSQEEIIAILSSIRFQIPFSNRIYFISNVYADCKDAEIVFVGDDG